MKAKVTLTVTLKNPDGQWSNTTNVSFPNAEALVGHVTQRIGKIIGERGIFEIAPTPEGGFHTKFIPYERVREINIFAQPSLIETDGDVEGAKKSASAISDLKSPLPFKSRHGAN